MSAISDVWNVVKDIGKFIIGDKAKPKLEESLGELEVEKVKQDIADRRRERASRKHGDNR